MYKRGSHMLDQRGFSLTEVMVSMVILPIAILGVTSMFQHANAGLQDGGKHAQALAIAEGRLEVKRIVPWETLLIDDLDADGVPELRMMDDGTLDDVAAGDGIFTSGVSQDGVHVTWTVQSIDGGSPTRAGMVLIKARATYQIGVRSRAIEVGTLRANPLYVGFH